MRRLLSKPWIWSFVAALSVWLATIVVTAGASTQGLSQAATPSISICTEIATSSMPIKRSTATSARCPSHL